MSLLEYWSIEDRQVSGSFMVCRFCYHNFKNVSKTGIRVCNELNLFKSLLITAITPRSCLWNTKKKRIEKETTKIYFEIFRVLDFSTRFSLVKDLILDLIYDVQFFYTLRPGDVPYDINFCV